MNAGYFEAERDVIAWLLTQSPVPVCQALAAKLSRGEHRSHCAQHPREEKQWEIPVTFTAATDSIWREMLRGELFAERLQVCATDDDGFVIVPFAPLLPVQLALVLAFLRDFPGIATIGDPVPFDVAHIRAPW